MSAVKRVVLPVLLPALLAFTCLMCGEDDLGKITQDMRDRLGDALGFDDGEYFEGPPPAEHAGDAAYPQITDSSFPESLEQGESFEITLVTDFTDIASVKGAVVYVEDAENHIRIQKELVAGVDYKLMATGNLPGGDAGGGHMILTGTVTDEMDDLWGHEYRLIIAMLNTDDEVGNYVTWKLELPRLEKEASEGEGEGESDGDASGYYALLCNSDEFDCSESDSQEVWACQNNTTICNNACPSGYQDEEGAQENVNCINCCFKNELVDVCDETQYNECWACFYYVYDMESGKSGTREEAYQTAQEQWDAYSSTASGCVE